MSEAFLTFACPKCGSENVRSIPLLVELGTSRLKFETVGAALGSGLYAGVGGALTDGTQESRFAQRMAPPKLRRVGSGAYVWGIPVSMVLSSIFISLALKISGISMGGILLKITYTTLSILFYFGVVRDMLEKKRSAKIYNKERFPAEYQAWKNSLICLRCGSNFSRI